MPELDSFALWVKEVNQQAEQIDHKTPIEYLTYDQIDSLKLDLRTEQAVKHIKALHEHNKGNIAFTYCFEKYNFSNLKELSPYEVKKMLYSGQSLHISQSTFSGYQRLEQTAFSNSAIVLDIDFYNEKDLKGLPAVNVIELMRLEGLFEYPRPSYIINTGNGLNIVYLLKQLPVKNKYFKGNINLRKLVIDKLNKQFKGWGVDKATKDITRINKLPGTNNYKTNNQVEIIDYKCSDWNNLVRYDLRDLAYELDIKPIKKKLKKKKSSSNIKNLHNIYTLNYYRVKDIEYILTTRADIRGFREKGLFLYALHHLKAYNDLERLSNDIYEVNGSLSHPLTEKEIERRILRQLNRNYLKYNFKNDTLIEWLDITENEMGNLKTIISKHYQLEKKKTKQKQDRRNENGLTSREQSKQDTMKIISELKDKGYKRKDILSELDMSVDTYKWYLKEIKKLIK